MRMLQYFWLFAVLVPPVQAHEGSPEDHSDIERVLRAFHASFTEAERDSMALKDTIAPTFTAIDMKGSADPQQWIPAYVHLRHALGPNWHPNVDYENDLTILKVHVHRGVATVVALEVGRNANSSWEAVNAYTLIRDGTWRLTSLAMNTPTRQ